MENFGLLTNEEINNIINNSEMSVDDVDAASSATAAAAAMGCAAAAAFAA